MHPPRLHIRTLMVVVAVFAAMLASATQVAKLTGLERDEISRAIRGTACVYMVFVAVRFGFPRAPD